MLENKTPILYVKPNLGKMLVYRGKDEKGNPKHDSYDRVVGLITDIAERSSMYNGEEIKSWQIRIEDEADVYILTVAYSSGFTRGLFNSLANADLSRPVKIGCYVKNEYNCASVMQNNIGLVKWKYGVDQIPKTEKVTVGTKTVIDDSKAVEWMLKVLSEIKSKIVSKKDAFEDEVLAITGGEFVETTAEKKTKKPRTQKLDANLKEISEEYGLNTPSVEEMPF